MKGLEKKLVDFLNKKFEKSFCLNWGKVSLITENIIVLSNFNNYALSDAQQFLEKYGYKLEGGNFIDKIVIFKK